MDISPIHIKSGIILAIVLGLMVLKRNSYVKGWFGELIVNLMASFFLDKKEYHLIKNVTLPTEDSTTQIDHIIVSKYGIFVVETKNMKGWIFGSENNAEWTQQIYNHKNKFQNPLRQNYRHTKVLEEILGLMPDRVFSAVVFVGDSTFKTEMPENVTFTRGYIDYIKSKKEPLFGEFEVKELIDKIKEYRLEPNIETHRAHVKNLEKKYPRKIKRKLRSARPTSPIYKFAVVAVVILVLGGVAKKTFIEKPDEATTGDSAVPHDQQQETPAQKELNKIYQYKDSTGKTRYTNVATSPNTMLVDENTKLVTRTMPIEISGDTILIPATIGNKGIRMETILVLDEGTPRTILPSTTADFIGAENLGVASVTDTNGKMIKGEKRKVSYFAVGKTVEPDFVFLAVDTQRNGRQGILGMDFKTKHPFHIDKENKTLVWE